MFSPESSKVSGFNLSAEKSWFSIYWKSLLLIFLNPIIFFSWLIPGSTSIFFRRSFLKLSYSSVKETWCFIKFIPSPCASTLTQDLLLKSERCFVLDLGNDGEKSNSSPGSLRGGSVNFKSGLPRIGSSASRSSFDFRISLYFYENH